MRSGVARSPILAISGVPRWKEEQREDPGKANEDTARYREHPLLIAMWETLHHVTYNVVITGTVAEEGRPVEIAGVVGV